MNKLICTLMVVLLGGCVSEQSESSSATTGQAGSLATFTIAKNNLYVMDESKVIAFSLDQPRTPKRFDDFLLSRRDGETIFNHQNDYVFIGKRTGVDILALDENGYMDHLAEHTHMTSCDPVVAQGNRSYVTTRAGQGCGFGDNVLEVLDITNMAQPSVMFREEMSAPSGLAVSGDDLFVCDIYDGLQRFKIEDSGSELSLTYGHINRIFDCNDIIIKDDLLILMHDDGVTQVRWQGDEFTVLSDLVTER